MESVGINRFTKLFFNININSFHTRRHMFGFTVNLKVPPVAQALWVHQGCLCCFSLCGQCFVSLGGTCRFFCECGFKSSVVVLKLGDVSSGYNRVPHGPTRNPSLPACKALVIPAW